MAGESAAQKVFGGEIARLKEEIAKRERELSDKLHYANIALGQAENERDYNLGVAAKLAKRVVEYLEKERGGSHDLAEVKLDMSTSAASVLKRVLEKQEATTENKKDA